MISLALLPWKYIVAAILAVTVVTGIGWKIYHNGLKAGRAEVQAQWDAEKISLLRQSEINAANVRASEDRVRADAKKDREVASAKIRKLTADKQRLISELQNRPSRPTESAVNVPQGGTAGASGGYCTGDKLYKQDGEFLAREVERADYLRIKLEQCQTRYNKLAAEIDKVNSQAQPVTAPEPPK